MLGQGRLHPDEAGRVATQKIPNPNIISPTGRQPVPRRSTSPLKFDQAAAGNLNDILNMGKPLPLTSAPGTTGSGQIAQPADRISSTLPAGELSKFRLPMAPATPPPAPGAQAARTSGPAGQTAEPEPTGFLKRGFVPRDASGPTGHLQQAIKDLPVKKLITTPPVQPRVINTQPQAQTAPPPAASPPPAATPPPPASPPAAAPPSPAAQPPPVQKAQPDPKAAKPPAAPPAAATSPATSPEAAQSPPPPVRAQVRDTQKADDEAKPKKKFSDIRGSFAGQPEWAQKAFSPDTGA